LEVGFEGERRGFVALFTVFKKEHEEREQREMYMMTRVNYTVNRPVSGKKKLARFTGRTGRFTEGSNL
jgi:hypothetical protein